MKVKSVFILLAIVCIIALVDCADQPDDNVNGFYQRVWTPAAEDYEGENVKMGTDGKKYKVDRGKYVKIGMSHDGPIPEEKATPMPYTGKDNRVGWFWK